MISASRIWQATMKQLVNEEDMALLQHRLTSTQSQASTHFLTRMIDDIDLAITKSNRAVQISTEHYSTSDEINRLQALKKDIIHQAMLTSRGMVDDLNVIIETEQNRFLRKNRFMESTSKWQKTVLDTIQRRRLHQIERAYFICKYKLATSFHSDTLQPNTSIVLHNIEMDPLLILM